MAIKGIIGESIDKFTKRQAKRGNFLNECYNEHTRNNADLVSINEVNAKSLIDRHSKDGYVIVSPCRGGKDFGLDEKNPRDKELLAKINHDRVKEFIDILKSTDFSYTPTYGGFIENKGTDDEENVYERSFVIYNHHKDGSVGDFQDLYDFAMDMCNKYNQESVLIKEPTNAPKYVKGNGDIDWEFSDDVAFNDLTQQYFTDLHKNSHKGMKDGSRPTRFSFLECYINPAPQCYGERHCRALMGEVFVSR